MSPERSLGHVAVLGGGIAGLASAHYLSRAGARVTLFESSDQLGGLGTFFQHEGDWLDRFYHVLVPTDHALFELIEELGRKDTIYWRDTSLGFIYGRKLYTLNTALDLLRFSPARFDDRIRLGLTALFATYVSRPGPLDDLTVESWLTRLSGRRAFEKFWKPLLEAKFGDAYRQVPALWYWSSFNREKGVKKEVKGYLRGGYKGLTDAIERSLRERGVEIRMKSPVERVDLVDGRPVLRVGGGALSFDRAISTVPLVQLRQIASGGGLASWLERVHTDIDYQGVVNALVMLRRSITPHYWIPVVASGAPFQGIVETTRTISQEDSGGRHLVYLMNYVHRTHPLFSRDPDAIRREYVQSLLELFPELRPDDVTGSVVFRAPFVEPLYTPGYGRRKPPFELVPERFYLATLTQVYPQVTSWNSSTAIARECVERLRGTVERGG